MSSTAATFTGTQKATKYDMMVEAIAALILIFIVMLVITRTLIASLVNVETVALSLSTRFGISVLVWQHIVSLDLN